MCMGALLTLLVLSLPPAVLFGGVFLVRTRDRREVDRGRSPYIVTFPSELDANSVLAWLRAISGTIRPAKTVLTTAQSIVFEVVASPEGIVHRLLVPWQREDDIIPQLRALAPGISVMPDTDRKYHEWTYAVEVGESDKSRPLNIPNPVATAHSLLASFSPLREGEAMLVQWVVTPSIPSRLPRTKKRSGFLQVADLNPDDIAEQRAKLGEPNFEAVLRVAGRASTPVRAKHLTDRVQSSIKATQTPTNHWIKLPGLQSRIIERVHRATSAMVWPAQLNASELTALIGWAIGSPNTPGLPRGAARVIAAPRSVPSEGIMLGINQFAGSERPVAVRYEDALMHTWIGGRNGVGKSALMANMAKQIMAAGNGLILMETEGNLYDSVLNYVPRERVDDVILLDFNDPFHVAGFNVLDQGKPDIVIDELIELFEHQYGGGVWSDEYIYNGLKTLGDAKNMLSIVDLMPLINPRTADEAAWADDLIRQVKDPELKRWWQRHDNRGKEQQQQRADPVLSRMNQFVARPELRHVFGQRESTFQISDVLRDGKILLINLKGVSSKTTSLVGTMLMNAIWHATKTVEKDHATYLLLDEFADFMNLPVNFETMLAQARKRKVGLVLANQHLDPLSPAVREGVLTNARNKIVLQSTARDAKLILPEMASKLDITDITGLQKYEALVDIVTPTGTSGAFSMRTYQPAKSTGVARLAVEHSRKSYTRPLQEVQTELLHRYDQTDKPVRQRSTLSGEDW